MAQLQPVPRGPSPFAGREGPLVVVVGIALIIAIVKPWGPETGGPMSSSIGSPTASASAAQASDSSELRKELFGPFEPEQEWSIWPAGYLTTVMYVARAPRTESGASPASPSVGPNTSPSSPAVPAPSTSSPPGADWPATIVVGAGHHLLWIGINTPRGWSLDRAVLSRTGKDGSALRRTVKDGTASVIETRRIATPWPDHFTALALAAPGVERSLAVWPAGTYSLELWVSPGNVHRTIKIRILTAPDPAPDASSPQR